MRIFHVNHSLLNHHTINFFKNPSSQNRCKGNKKSNISDKKYYRVYYNFTHRISNRGLNKRVDNS